MCQNVDSSRTNGCSLDRLAIILCCCQQKGNNQRLLLTTLFRAPAFSFHHIVTGEGGRLAAFLIGCSSNEGILSPHWNLLARIGGLVRS
ncbi:hypothetical protein PVAP13_1NG087400 [Panicum virgatum]|uniref:Uncharacterized protein n=1 Tax=Panicum virgatum TaxID=38727 RepID=A0A8T0WHW5_PANVG|nr:hypothetical protein PVAP13_1NG087400 [Panicum virgatum]